MSYRFFAPGSRRALGRLLAGRSERIGWKEIADVVVGDWDLGRLYIVGLACAVMVRAGARLLAGAGLALLGTRQVRRWMAQIRSRAGGLRPSLRLTSRLLAVLVVLALLWILKGALAVALSGIQAALDHWPGFWVLMAIAVIAGTRTWLTRLCRRAICVVAAEAARRQTPGPTGDGPSGPAETDNGQRRTRPPAVWARRCRPVHQHGGGGNQGGRRRKPIRE